MSELPAGGGSSAAPLGAVPAQTAAAGQSGSGGLSRTGLIAVCVVVAGEEPTQSTLMVDYLDVVSDRQTFQTALP